MKKKKENYWVEKEVRLNDLDFEFSKKEFDCLDSQTDFKKSLEERLSKDLVTTVRKIIKFPRPTKTHRIPYSITHFKILSDICVEFKDDKVLLSNICGIFTIIFIYIPIEILPKEPTRMMIIARSELETYLNEK